MNDELGAGLFFEYSPFFIIHHSSFIVSSKDSDRIKEAYYVIEGKIEQID